MKKIYYLKTCDTCKKILRTLPLEGFVMQDIKTQPITVTQLEEMRSKVGSYKALFSKLAKKYKEFSLRNEVLSEDDMKHFILEDYTFLKRPVILINDCIFVGHSRKNLEDLKNMMEGSH